MNETSSLPRMATVAAGADLIAVLADLSGSDAWVSAAGYVEGVELRVAAETGDAVSELRGRFNLLSLAGPRGGPYAVTLARSSDAGMQVLGGELVRARSAGVTVTILPVARDAVRAASGQSRTATWATAAAASAATARDEPEPADEILPDAGDLVQHFAFGVCEVLTSDGDRLRIRDLEGPRRVREVALSMLRVTGPTDSGGKRLFQLERRSPGG